MKILSSNKVLKSIEEFKHFAYNVHPFCTNYKENIPSYTENVKKDHEICKFLSKLDSFILDGKKVKLNEYSDRDGYYNYTIVYL